MIVVVYKKSQNAKKKYMSVFKNEQTPDRISGWENLLLILINKSTK